MLRAIELAKLGKLTVQSNPMVGAVIVHKNKIIGEGFHMNYGKAHAEVNAVNSVSDPSLLKESTIYVTLEPCAHQGKTPPCADLIVRHKFKRCVVATKDPFAQVNGLGIERIKQAGIEVSEQVCEQEALSLNKVFFKNQIEQKPYVTLKWAQTADGFLDKKRHNAQSKPLKISGSSFNRFTHQMRSENDAILIGSNTARLDQPSLNTRNWAGRSPIPIILDFKKSLEESALNNLSTNKILIQDEKYKDLNCLLKHLYTIGVQSLLVEGGSYTHQQFIEQNQWDEAFIVASDQVIEVGVAAPQVSKDSVCLASPYPETIYHSRYS